MTTLYWARYLLLVLLALVVIVMLYVHVSRAR